MSDDLAKRAEDDAKLAEEWARNIAWDADVRFVVPGIKAFVGVTRTLVEYHFERVAEFAAAKVTMHLINMGHKVELDVHADSWIRIALSVENHILGLPSPGGTAADE
ncbi:hypothetical protein AB0I84_07430 [Streptomyces spectabilis]|uniref:hypothetical protein n=1 Tax=Streptomyces spectabilis TaxID=68270 RepID=UPI0033C67588